jgi:2-polyprenyl-3-methyl-5-hydroxy-6-metoxy-1,4-benzoquinol methylase
MISNFKEYEKMAFVEKKLWWYRILHEKVLKSVIDNQIPKKDFILDLGCGTGGLLEKLIALGYNNVKGIDTSDFAIDFCKKKVLR